ncbi:Fumarate hydratase class I, aerobic [Porphyridium purpureum]|uniref:fumarate hydratase n=1 Tax=Porphyridium purpureum TaxID=35688 RepID=A0A5J4YNQ0_PORPP|nr:Fumarate hydratase class I, aerobic [Porphyridium purpureum]|eukprot:POR0104..scf295_9
MFVGIGRATAVAAEAPAIRARPASIDVTMSMRSAMNARRCWSAWARKLDACGGVAACLRTVTRSDGARKNPYVRMQSTTPAFQYKELFPADSSATAETEYRKIEGSEKWVEEVTLGNRTFLQVDPQALRKLSADAFVDIAHLLRPAHLQQLSNILKDPEASSNDRFVALELLKNANIASGMILPGCQDTGTAIILAKRGMNVLTDGNDEEALSHGVFDTYTGTNLRYSQVAPLDMYTEVNTKTNLPAQIDIMATKGSEYNFLFIAKGGGSANKTFLYQQTKALLNEKKLMAFLEEKIKTLGTAACPPYHLAIVVGGLSAELTLKTVKLVSTKYLDSLPTSGSEFGQAFRDLELEKKVLHLCQQLGIGAQFGGKYFCHDVRVVRLPRHGASCPVGIGVSCSADRQAKGKITKEGVFLEKLERDVGKYLPEVTEDALGKEDASSQVVEVNLNEPMDQIRLKLSKYPIRTRLSLTGTMVVARDIAHAKLLERVENNEPLPDYVKNHIIYYAGPAKTPAGYASGSFGPTTAGRMDAYVDTLMKHGASFLTLAKGNRSKVVTKACKQYGGFYLGSIGGPAAILAQNCIKKVDVLEYPELGMEAIWRIEVENFPAFIVVDDKGNDFFEKWAM